MKVTVVGSGFVGQTAAMRLLEKGLGEVCLIDIVEGKPQGLASDLKEAAPIEGYRAADHRHERLRDTAGSDVVVITAGLPAAAGHEPDGPAGQERGDHDASVVEHVVPGRRTPSSSWSSNPLDEMTYLAAERERVPEGAGARDGRRPRLGAAALTSSRRSSASRRLEVEAMTLGSHGDVDGRPPAARDRGRAAAAGARRRGHARASVPADARRGRRDRGAPEEAAPRTTPRAPPSRHGRRHRRATRRRSCPCAPG